MRTDRKEIFIKSILLIKQEHFEKKEESIEQLSEILLGEILNRMSRYCRDCKEYYVIKLDEKPAIKCIACKVGYHKCNGGDTTGKALNSLGFYWFCSECESTFTEHYLPKLDRIATFSGFNRTKQSQKLKISLIGLFPLRVETEVPTKKKVKKKKTRSNK